MQQIITAFSKRALIILSILGCSLLVACGSLPPPDSGDSPLQPAKTPTPTSPVSTPVPTSPSTGSSEFAKYINQNLIINGNAELGSAGTFEKPVAGDIPGWTRTGTFTVLSYVQGETIGGIGNNDPRPDDHGNNYFAGGPAGGPDALATATQTIDISPLALIVDSGKLSYTLSGYLGGWGSYTNQADVKVQFLGADKHDLGSPAQIGPVQAGNNGQAKEATGLWQRTTSKALPSGTRYLQVTLTMSVDPNVRVAANNSANTAFADSLSFTLKY